MRDKAIAWLAGAEKDISEGIAILGKVCKNMFYLNNLARYPRKRALVALEYELKKAFKVRVGDLATWRLGEKERIGEDEKTRGREGATDLNDCADCHEGHELHVRASDESDDGELQVVTDDTKLVRNKIRKEFPFLNEANCPEEFKVLVADMIRAYYEYVENHPNLFEASDSVECFEAAKNVVEPYLENREIWAELTHYKVTGKILGKHPVFEDRKRQDEYRKMKPQDLYELYMKKLPRRIWQNNKKVQDEPNSEYNGERLQRANEYERDRIFIAHLLNIDYKATENERGK